MTSILYYLFTNFTMFVFLCEIVLMTVRPDRQPVVRTGISVVLRTDITDHSVSRHLSCRRSGSFLFKLKHLASYFSALLTKPVSASASRQTGIQFTVHSLQEVTLTPFDKFTRIHLMDCHIIIIK